jgi:hypothetical protein
MKTVRSNPPVPAALIPTVNSSAVSRVANYAENLGVAAFNRNSRADRDGNHGEVEARRVADLGSLCFQLFVDSRQSISVDAVAEAPTTVAD